MAVSVNDRRTKIKVLQVIPPVGIGGAERLVVDLAKYINKDEFEVAVLSLGNQLAEIYQEELRESQVPSIFIKVQTAFHPLTIYRVTRFLLRFKPHIIHTHLKAIRYVILPSLFSPVLAHIHTIHSIARRDTSSPFNRFINRIAFKCFGVKPVCVSKEVANSIKAVYGVEALRIYNGVNLSRYFAERPREKKDQTVYVLNVGRMKKEKNHKLLLEAFNKVRSKDSRARLIIVGDGELKPALEGKVRQLGLNGAVSFHGWRNDVPELMRDCDIFVLSSDVEGCPEVVLEAMASGKPVVATRVGGVPELVEYGITGFLVPPQDSDALAESMLRLIKDSELREEMGRRGREKAIKGFALSIAIQRYEELYKRVISEVIIKSAKT
ncbi:glycosyltransferase [bacterium]|nr:glycosyltransferase [bacterium]